VGLRGIRYRGMNKQIINRIKSFLWRAGGFAVVATGAYVLQVGDIFMLDLKVLVNLAVLTVIGLVVGEITKFLNPKGS